MKLKSIPAQTEKTPMSAQRTTDSAASLPSVKQPFESFVRSMVATKKTATTTPTQSTIPTAEEVIAQTEVDGMRYVMLRCELSSKGTNVALSPREREIVSLIAKGFPNKTIADVLEISTWTVGTHLRRIFAKMGVTSRAAMVAKHFHGNTGGIIVQPPDARAMV